MTRFLKMHGLGNDFVVFDARKSGLVLDAALARAVADRREGIGCDQVIVIEQAKNGADAAMRIFNADGGEVESCGNAARCVARLLMEEKDSDRIRLETVGGPLICEDTAGGLVTIDMGPPRFGWREVPLARDVDTKSFALDVPGFDLPALKSVSAVSVGNPHCVLFVADAPAAPVDTLGPAIERHAMFPERTNVEFVSAIGANRLRMRVWERGVGITRACGTGAAATMAAAHRRGLVGNSAEIVLDGGVLQFSWDGKGSIFMTGPAALSFSGDVDLAALERAP
jgi:diaminopimelate epimerase